MKNIYDITDIHTHILPGLDDGSKNWDMTMDIIQKSWDMGVRKIIATPHYLPWKPETTPEVIQSLCSEAEDRAKKELGIDMKIYPGQEIYFHLDVLKHLKEKKIQTMNNTRYILVEFDTGISWHDLKHAVHVMVHGGYKPILAHVERYECLRKKGYVEELIDSRALLQINIRSLAGGMFDSDANWCRKQIKQGYISFLASDAHNMTSRPPFSQSGMEWLVKKADEQTIRSLTKENADRYFGLL